MYWSICMMMMQYNIYFLHCLCLLLCLFWIWGWQQKNATKELFSLPLVAAQAYNCVQSVQEHDAIQGHSNSNDSLDNSLLNLAGIVCTVHCGKSALYDQPTHVGRESADCRPTNGRHFTNTWPTLHRQSAVSRPLVDQPWWGNCWPTNDRLSTD